MSHLYTDTAAVTLTPAQVGKLYEVSSDTVLRWFHEGKIPAVVAEGQIYRFDGEAVAKALRARARKKAKENAGAALG